jgi:two-component system cell cycle sensor histidine kinase/response regulator CckA
LIAPPRFVASAPPLADRHGRAPGRGLLFLLVAALALASAALLFWAVRDPIFAAAFLAGVGGMGALLVALPRRRAEEAEEAAPHADIALLRAALDASGAAAALTGPDGELICASRSYCSWFGGAVPPQRFRDFEEEMRAARRDGSAEVEEFPLQGELYRAELREASGHIVWTFHRPVAADLPRDAERLLGGDAGRRLGEAGVMAVLADEPRRQRCLRRPRARRGRRRSRGRRARFLPGRERGGAVPVRG